MAIQLIEALKPREIFENAVLRHFQKFLWVSWQRKAL
jgi:hypothetical protein